MSKWVLDTGGPLDYPSLGFRCTTGSILSATAAPDARWSLNGDQGAAETVTRYTIGGDPSYVEPTDHYVLAWDVDDNTYVPTDPAVLLATTEWSDALSASYVGVATPEMFDATAGSGGDDTAAIQDAIDTGLPVLLRNDKTYLAHGLVAPPGMRLSGYGLGNAGVGRARLRASGGDLFTTPSSGTAYCHSFRIENVVLDSHTSGGHIFRGLWSQGSFSNCRFVQYNTAKSVFDITGLIDVTFEGACEAVHVTTATVPAIKIISDAGEVAQVDFGTLRCTDGSATVHFFHIEGRDGYVPVNLGFSNVNFENTVGGCAKLLSCRFVKFTNTGAWDFSTAAVNHLFHIAKSDTVGAKTPRMITFEQVLRDAGTPPASGVYDIYVDPAAGMADLNVIDCGNQNTESFKVSAGNSTGHIRGHGVTALVAATNMTTDTWQPYTPTIAGTSVALGDGTITGEFKNSGDTCEFRASLTLGSTTSLGSSLVGFTIPSAAAAVASSHIQGFALDTGSAYYNLAGEMANGLDLARLWVLGTGGAYSAGVSDTAPFTWAPSDVLRIHGTYTRATA